MSLLFSIFSNSYDVTRWFYENTKKITLRNFNSEAVGVRYCLGCWKGLVKNWPLKMKFFWFQGVFSVYNDFQNWCENEIQDNNEKSCNWFKNKGPQKIDFRADGTHRSHPTAWELRKFRNMLVQISKDSFLGVPL